MLCAWADHLIGKCTVFTKYSTNIYYLCVERVAITDFDPGSSFFVMSRFLHSEELTPVVAAFLVSILKTPTEKASLARPVSALHCMCTNLDITKEFVRSKTRNIGDHHSTPSTHR